ncbi:MAG: hypothetical protein ACYDH5_18095 [Acidimicrobiales bacterium]
MRLGDDGALIGACPQGLASQLAGARLFQLKPADAAELLRPGSQTQRETDSEALLPSQRKRTGIFQSRATPAPAPPIDRIPANLP